MRVSELICRLQKLVDIYDDDMIVGILDDPTRDDPLGMLYIESVSIDATEQPRRVVIQAMYR